MGCRLEAARLEKVTSPTRTSADEEGEMEVVEATFPTCWNPRATELGRPIISKRLI